MFIELVELLRCPEPHEPCSLVAAVEEYHGRHIGRGVLGCPVCHRQYRVDRGAVAFADHLARPVRPAPPAADAVLRAQALLGLSEPGGTVALVGTAAALADALEEAASVAVLLVNPAGVAPRPGLSAIWVRESLPLAPGSLRGALVGEGAATVLLPGLVRALRPRGRLVAPAALPVPMDLAELARDDRQWVGERPPDVTTSPVALRRR